MTKSSRFIFALATCACIGTPLSAQASVEITEVMYDAQGSDTGQEWVELHNSGESAVTMTAGTHGWKLSDGSNHLLVDPASGTGQGSLTLVPGGFAIVTSDPSAFLSKYPGSYSVIKSAISLNNTGATIALLDDSGSTVDSVTYTKDMGAAGDGNSLHRTDSGLAAALPDPGVYQSTSAAAAPEQSPQTTSATADFSAQTGATQPQTKTVGLPPSLIAHAKTSSSVVVGAGSTFSGSATTQNGTPATNVRYVWSFGDGTMAEGQNILHTYSYPGTYVAVLTAASGIAEGSDRATVEVLPAQITLVAGADGSLTLTNTGKQELDIGSWSVTMGHDSFTVPAHTVVLAGKAVRLASSAMHMTAGEGTALYYPNGTLAARASAEPLASVPAATTTSATAPAAARVRMPVVSARAPAKVATVSLAPTEPQSQQAAQESSTSASVVLEAGAEAAPAAAGIPMGWEYALGLGALVVMGASSLLYLRLGQGPHEETLTGAEEFTIDD